MADSIAERVKRRRNSHVEDEDTIVQASEVSLGEKVLLCKLIRDGILKHFNPCKLSDLQYVLELALLQGSGERRGPEGDVLQAGVGGSGGGV